MAYKAIRLRRLKNQLHLDASKRDNIPNESDKTHAYFVKILEDVHSKLKKWYNTKADFISHGAIEISTINNLLARQSDIVVIKIYIVRCQRTKMIRLVRLSGGCSNHLDLRQLFRTKLINQTDCPKDSPSPSP